MVEGPTIVASLPYSSPASAADSAVPNSGLRGQHAEAGDAVDGRRMGRHEVRRALLELLDGIREVHVLRAAVGYLENLDIRPRSWPTPVRVP